jgi:Winged helix DNA-binding domain
MRVPDKAQWRDVCARRLRRHWLTRPAPDAATAAAGMCAAHAQIQTAAELSVALRLDGATRSDVRRALWEDRTLVRTFGPRGTVHLVAAVDLAMWTGALSAVPRSSSQPADVRLEDEQVDAVVAALGTAVAKGDRTVDELDEAVADACGEWAIARVMPAFQTMWPRWRQVVSTAAARGALCFGPSRGREITYASPRRWISGFAPAPTDEALRALVHAYLAAFGPASSAHFAQWLAVSPAWAAAQFDSMAEMIEPVELDGETCWVNADDQPIPSGSPAGLWLLPYFDAYAVGGQPRRLVFPGLAAERALARTQAGNFPVLLIDGVVSGVWHQRRAGRRIQITVEPLRRLAARHCRALDHAAERVGTILEGRPELTIGEVAVGPHA